MATRQKNLQRNAIAEIANDVAFRCLFEMVNKPGESYAMLSPEKRAILEKLKPSDMDDLRPVEHGRVRPRY